MKKFRKKTKNENFEQCHIAEKCKKRGILYDFLTSMLLQNITKIEGGPFGLIKKFSRKSAEKIEVKNTKIAKGGILSKFPRFWTSVLFWTRL